MPHRLTAPSFTAITKDKASFSRLVHTLCQIPPLVLRGSLQDTDKLISLRRTATTEIEELMVNAYKVTGPNETQSVNMDLKNHEIQALQLEAMVMLQERIRIRINYKQVFDSVPSVMWLELDPVEYFRNEPTK